MLGADGIHAHTAGMLAILTSPCVARCTRVLRFEVAEEAAALIV